MGNKYSRGFSRPDHIDDDDKLTYPRKHNSALKESMGHIWGTEHGENLLLPICAYPG